MHEKTKCMHDGYNVQKADSAQDMTQTQKIETQADRWTRHTPQYLPTKGLGLCQLESTKNGLTEILTIDYHYFIYWGTLQT